MFGQGYQMANDIKSAASGIISGTNPAYTLADFLQNFPQFGGSSVSISGVATADSPIITSVSTTTGISVGMLACGLSHNIPDNTTVISISVDDSSITLSADATLSEGVSLTFYSPLIDPDILSMYVSLANACIKQQRWQAHWKIAMGWFIAHFATLYLQSYVDPGSSAAKVMEAGRTRGLMSSKSVGDVSVSYDFTNVVNDLDGWAAWKLTVYGQQLATFGKLIGTGGMYVW